MFYSNQSNTEILATMGPTLGEEEQIVKAMRLGVKNFRLHIGIRAQNQCDYFKNVRMAEQKLHAHAEVLVDLPAAKPRMGNCEATKPVVGKQYRMQDIDKTIEEFVIPLRGFTKLLPGIKVGDHIVFSDGKIVFQITEILPWELVTICVFSAGTLYPQISSCVFPDSEVEFDPFGQNDLAQLQRMKDSCLQPDWVAISFASDKLYIQTVKDTLRSIWNSDIKVMAKIESRKGLQNFAEILNCTDGIMVARGDLLSFIEPYTLPYIQQELVKKTLAQKKPVVVATEMLERFAQTGMISRPELSDIALAVRQGASAVMLSVESSNCECVMACISLMNQLIQFERERTAYGRQ